MGIIWEALDVLHGRAHKYRLANENANHVGKYENYKYCHH